MTQADSVHSTPPLTTSASSALTEVAHELFNLEERFLRVRNLTYAVRMAASSVEISKEPTDAIEALTDTILDEIGELIEERRRLCHLASGHEEGADGDPRPIKGDGPMKAPGCSSEFDGVIGLSETLCVFDGDCAAGHASDLSKRERAALADYMILLWTQFRDE